MDDLRERVLRKKLLYDGYGTYEERKIIQLIKDVAKLYLTDLAEDEFQKLYSLTTKNINSVLLNADKAIRISERCDRQILSIEQAIQEHEQLMEGARSELAGLQLELEYVDKLKNISAFPDCTTTEAQIRDVMKRKERLMTQVKKYRQHIMIILKSCKELRQVLDDGPETQNNSNPNLNPNSNATTNSPPHEMETERDVKSMAKANEENKLG